MSPANFSSATASRAGDRHPRLGVNGNGHGEDVASGWGRHSLPDFSEKLPAGRTQADAQLA